MPELPEVEITRRHLESWLQGGRVTLARAADTRITRDSPRVFGRSLVGATITGIARRGKWVRIALSSGRIVFSHLGMTGKWVPAAKGDPPASAEHARLDVRRQGKVVSARYTDPRRFGRLLVADEDIPEWCSLGPDPFSDGLDARGLSQALAKKRGPIKVVLLDQTVLAGVGNIVATDALFRARIDPMATANRLPSDRLRALVRALHTTIAEGIAEHERSSLRYLHEIDGVNTFLIYGREGEPCPRCKTTIAKRMLGGRTTAYCPGCQAPGGPRRR